MLCEHGNIAPCVECDIEPMKAECEELRKAAETSAADANDAERELETIKAKCDALAEALETALFGTPLDDVPNRDNDDIWSLCYPHLSERASDALRDHLVRIETALTAYRRGSDHDN